MRATASGTVLLIVATCVPFLRNPLLRNSGGARIRAKRAEKALILRTQAFESAHMLQQR